MSEAKWEMTSQYLLRLENLLSARGTRTATACWIAAVASVSDKNRFQIRKYVHKIFCRFHLYRGGWEGPLKRSGAGCVLYVSTFIFPLDRSQHFLNFRCFVITAYRGMWSMYAEKIKTIRAFRLVMVAHTCFATNIHI